MKNRVRFLLAGVMICTAAAQSHSQTMPVKSLAIGDAYLYHKYYVMHGGQYVNQNITVTVVSDTVIDGLTFHRLSDGTTEYADSIRLLTYHAGTTRVQCSFDWEPGDSLTYANEPLYVIDKGTEEFLSAPRPYTHLKLSSTHDWKFIKPFGLIYLDWNVGMGMSKVNLLGARIGGVVYGMAPATSVEEQRPTAYALEQNYPNPFNPSTTIRYSIPVWSHVTLTVHDLLGRRAAMLVDEDREPGSYEARFDGRGMASGVYFYRMTAGSFVGARTFVLVK